MQTNAATLELTIGQVVTVFVVLIPAAAFVVGLLVRNAVIISGHSMRITTLEGDKINLKEEIEKDTSKIIEQLANILEKIEDINTKIGYLEGQRDGSRKGRTAHE